MLVMFAGHPLNCINYDLKERGGSGWDSSEWNSAKQELKLLNPLVNLPYVCDGGQVISQSNACLSYLGRKFGLWGTDAQSIILCEQLLCEIMDIRNKHTNLCYGNLAVDEESVRGLCNQVTGKNGGFLKLESLLEAEVSKYGYSGKHLVGDKPTAPDFHLWEIMDHYSKLADFYNIKELFHNFPRLAYFYSNFPNLPGNLRYFQSKLSQLPISNKVGKYGANPDGSIWKRGQYYDWGDISGIY